MAASLYISVLVCCCFCCPNCLAYKRISPLKAVQKRPLRLHVPARRLILATVYFAATSRPAGFLRLHFFFFLNMSCAHTADITALHPLRAPCTLACLEPTAPGFRPSKKTVDNRDLSPGTTLRARQRAGLLSRSWCQKDRNKKLYIYIYK